MAKKPTTGREAVFRGKVDGYRVQGVLTKRGGQMFNAARKELAAIHTKATGRIIETVSDADVIEFLSRGQAETERYLELQSAGWKRG